VSSSAATENNSRVSLVKHETLGTSTSGMSAQDKMRATIFDEAIILLQLDAVFCAACGFRL
jgi:hypothetical protein